MTLNEIFKFIKSPHSVHNRVVEINTLIDDFMLTPYDYDYDLLLLSIQQKLDGRTKLVAELKAKDDIVALGTNEKLSSDLLSELSNLLNLITVARLFAALSLHELRKQNNINDRVIIAMTEKFTPVQLSSVFFQLST